MPKLKFIFLLLLGAHLSVSQRGEVAGERLAFGNLTDLASSPGSSCFWLGDPGQVASPPAPPRASGSEGWRAAEGSFHFVLYSSPDREERE